VGYLGCPGTTSAPYIDYIVADEIVIPRDQQQHFSENVIYLPDTYQANDGSRPQPVATAGRAALGLPENGFVFCSFNNSFKITPDIFDMWMRLLRQVEGSVLWLFEGHPACKINLRREAQARGIAPERLVFAPRVKHEEHLARHQAADLFLDTLHYGAHTTASDALWAGLPVLTCPGVTFASRVAASLLTAIGMPELFIASLTDYETLAVNLARNPNDLKAIKAKLAAHRHAYPLFDTERFTRNLEAAYRQMWGRYRRGEAPASFSVTAPHP
jgi:protein O-GlcNAc transferase